MASEEKHVGYRLIIMVHEYDISKRVLVWIKHYSKIVLYLIINIEELKKKMTRVKERRNNL